MKPIIFLVLCFPLKYAYAQTIDELINALTSGNQKKWNFNPAVSDTISKGLTLYTMNFHLSGKRVDTQSCKGDTCADNSLNWQLDSLVGRFNLTFSRDLDVLSNNKTFEIQFVQKNGTKFLRLRRNGDTIEQGTLNYYFQ